MARCFHQAAVGNLSNQFLRAMPKAELHQHLDGSLRISSLCELLRNKDCAPVPAAPSGKWTEDLFKEHIFKPHYTDLMDYLQGFTYTTAALSTAEGQQRVGYELALDSHAGGVYYVETRFSPQLLASTKIPVREVLKNVNAGLEQGRRELHMQASNSRTDGPPPPLFNYALIVCGMRSFVPQMSEYFANFHSLWPHLQPGKRAGLASLALVHEAIAARDEDGIPVVALDIAGAECGYPNKQHVAAYHVARQAFLHSTVHAGEAYGPESIYQAITSLYASRIGHGYHLYHPDSIKDPRIADKEQYVQQLREFMAENRTCIEVCLTSNLQTLPELANAGLATHSLQRMLEDDLRVSLCTDNALMSKTDLANEYRLAVDNFPALQDPARLKKLVMGGFKSSFFPGSYADKKSYTEQAGAFFDAVYAQHQA